MRDYIEECEEKFLYRWLVLHVVVTVFPLFILHHRPFHPWTFYIRQPGNATLLLLTLLFDFIWGWVAIPPGWPPPAINPPTIESLSWEGNLCSCTDANLCLCQEIKETFVIKPFMKPYVHSPIKRIWKLLLSSTSLELQVFLSVSCTFSKLFLIVQAPPLGNVPLWSSHRVLLIMHSSRCLVKLGTGLLGQPQIYWSNIK